MKNVMIIKWQANSYFLKYLKSKNIYQLYKTDNYKKIIKQIDKFGFDNLPLGNWTKKVKNADIVVFFDSFFNDTALNIVKQENKKAKVYLYFWNKINKDNKHLLNKKGIDAFYTFDPEDSKVYNLKYNPQFYTNKIRLKNKKPKFDVCFLGRDKGRNDTIEEVKTKLSNYNLKTDIRVITNEDEFISYSKYLKMIEDSKCILDIAANNQKGASLRVLESLFFNKKLITNNKNIVNYDFYNKKNIFVIGKDKWSDLPKLVGTYFQPINNNIIIKYDFQKWIERFED